MDSPRNVLAGVVAGLDALIAVHTDRRIELIPAELQLLRSWTEELRALADLKNYTECTEITQETKPFSCPFYKPGKR